MGHNQKSIRSFYGSKKKESLDGISNKKSNSGVLNNDDIDGLPVAMGVEEHEKGYAFNATVVVDFMDGVIPNRNLFKEKKGNMLNIIVLNHDYFKIFSGATMNISRTCRFLGLVIIVMSEIFTDTLFFGIFYPSDGTCNVYKTEVRIFLCIVDGFQLMEIPVFLMRCIYWILDLFPILLSFLEYLYC
jgi:hypothetical protein